MPEDPLSEYGVIQSRNIINDLAELKIDTILCSPFKRAIDTITPFSIDSNIPFSIVPSLAEGQLVLEENIENEKPYYEDNGYPKQNETKGQFLSRAIDSIEHIKNFKNQKILVVSHGHMIREMLNIILSCSTKVRFPHENCGLTSITIESNPKIHYINKVLGYNKLSQQDASKAGASA